MAKEKPSATMDDIAQLAQVSKATVSRALQGNPLVNAETRAHVLRIAEEHGYSVNRHARKLWAKRANTVAVVQRLPVSAGRSVLAPFMFQLLEDISKGLWIRGQDVLLMPPDSDDPSTYRAMLASKGADGFIFLGQGEGDDWLVKLAKTEVPFVVWGAMDDRARYCTVGSDNRKGGQLVGEYFARLKRDRVLFLGNTSHPEIRQRYQGLEAGLAGAAVLTERVIPDFTFETGYLAGRELAHDRAAMPDAIFTASDSVAMGVIIALLESGVRIPDEVSVVGYDDVPLAAHFRLPLTTVRQDTHQGGSLLVEKLFQSLDGAKPQSTILPTMLVVRST